MSGALVAKLAVPLILEALRSGLGEINHPAAQGASTALGELQDAVNNGAITPEQMAHIEKMQAIEADARAKILESINATARVEVASSDPYVRRMRPTFGYMMAVTWGAQMLAIAYIIIAEPSSARNVMQGMEALGTMWAVALSVLGIYVYQRSAEKKFDFETPSFLRKQESTQNAFSMDPGFHRGDDGGRANKNPAPTYND